MNRSQQDHDWIIRPVQRRDLPAVIALIDRVYREYGERMHLENADADLPIADSHFSGLGGAFVVLEQGPHIVGCHAVKPLDVAKKIVTFRRLYLSQECRGTGQGTALMEWAITWARTAGWRRIEFWSDTRFARAHRFFEKFGFQRDGRIREMHDSFEPYQEFGYFLDLPIETQ